MAEANELRVSVVIPAYNPGPYLRVALESVTRQTYRNWEVMVVDDGSSEDLRWIESEYPKAKLFRQENRGVSVARNQGILRTTGELIAFMDQDDIWEKHKLERQVMALARYPAAGVCHCDLRIIDKDGRGDTSAADGDGPTAQEPIVELDPSTGHDAMGLSPLHRSLRYFSQRFIVPSTVMIRRTCLASAGLLDPFIPFSGDYDLLIKIGSRHSVLHVPQADVGYRKHDNNYSDRYEVGRREVAALISRYESYARTQGDKVLLRSAKSLLKRPSSMYAAQAFDCARRSLAQRSKRSFVIHFTNAFLFSPVFVGKSLCTWMWGKVHSQTDSAA